MAAGGWSVHGPDYYRFVSMLLDRGELDGTRLLGPLTTGLMVRNQLPGDADLESFGGP